MSQVKQCGSKVRAKLLTLLTSVNTPGLDCNFWYDGPEALSSRRVLFWWIRIG